MDTEPDRRRIYDEVIERVARALCADASGMACDSGYVNRRWVSFKSVAITAYNELIAIDEERFNNKNEENENDQSSTDQTGAGNGNPAHDTVGTPPEKSD